MREKTVVPTTLLDWPKVVDLLPEQKLILMMCWAGRYTNGIGVIEAPPLAAMAASLGLSRPALVTGLINLEHARCIVWDRETDEICVSDWHRFHRFVGVGEQIARREAGKVRSATIKAHLAKVAPGLFAEVIHKPKENRDITPQAQAQAQAQAPHPQGVGGVAGGVPEIWRLAAAMEVADAEKIGRVRSPEGLRKKILDRYAREGGPAHEVLAAAEKKLFAKDEAQIFARLRALHGRSFIDATGIPFRIERMGKDGAVRRNDDGGVSRFSAVVGRQLLDALASGRVRGGA